MEQKSMGRILKIHIMTYKSNYIPKFNFGIKKKLGDLNFFFLKWNLKKSFIFLNSTHWNQVILYDDFFTIFSIDLNRKIKHCACGLLPWKVSAEFPPIIPPNSPSKHPVTSTHHDQNSWTKPRGRHIFSKTNTSNASTGTYHFRRIIKKLPNYASSPHPTSLWTSSSL